MNEEPFVPIETLAKHFSVSVPTIRSWYRTNRIPPEAYIKVGNTYRFRVSAVEDVLLNSIPKDEPIDLAGEQYEHDLLSAGDIDIDDDV
jgi:hypothetical protein|tara:strand:+ start:563 stop:829 length:267 start_codon:yes stop_codon:yes gene_type:complete